MRDFAKLSIKWKIIFVIMLTSVLTLALASIAFVAKDHLSYRQRRTTELFYLAKIIGMTSEGSLLFNDHSTAEKNLSAISQIDHVICAAIYDDAGKRFVTYNRPGPQEISKELLFPETPEPTGYKFTKDALLLFQEIVIGNKFMGTVFLRYDLAVMHKDLMQSVIIVFAIMMVAILVSLLLSQILQRVISAPILDLAQTARTITRDQDYSARAQKRGKDEIGVLIDDFNKMLAEIQSKEKELIRHREHLEDAVSKRTQELKQANMALTEAKEAAETASRAKSEFLASVSHEIRTPLNSVLGFSELLNSMITDKTQKSYIESVRASGKSLLTLINDILDLSKIEASKLEFQYEPMNPRMIVQEIKDLFSLKLSEKNLDFYVEISDEVPEGLILDEVRFRQILFNLIGNAVKFTEKGYVSLSLSIAGENVDEDSVVLEIAVEDTGIGIPKESMKSIFEAFRQQDGQSAKRYGGTGLGLAITKRLVEMMNGTISVESVAGKGSLFVIRLHGVSIAADFREGKKDKNADHKAKQDVIFAPARVMIVDDIESNRRLVKEFFRETRVRCQEAENGAKAISLAETQAPDLILMDLRMPVMDGYAAARIIRENEDLKNIPIIALTASGMRQEQEKAKKMGFDGFITKPIQKHYLFQVLSRYLKNEEPTGTSLDLQEQEDDSHQKPVSPDILSSLPAILHTLETELTETWNAVKSTGFFDEIGEFAKRIQALGKEFRIGFLEEYGSELYTQSESFDIEKINKTMEMFPELIERVRRIKTR